jgi:prepilin-type N-terminal cleavage/methylation domain-containing protein
MKRRTHAFTLAELLTVIAVIALLLTVVAAAYPSALSTARRILCANNLHQLGTLVHLTRDRLADEGEHTVEYSDFLHTLQWPDRVYETGKQRSTLFRCPEAEAFLPENPEILYRSGMYPNVYIPFDPAEFLCVMRKGVDEEGQHYTEYCVEENIHVEAKWEYAGGTKEFSTNDGIWRVYDEGVDGKRRLILMFYNCGATNQLYVNGEIYADDMRAKVGMTLYFSYCPTNYGYNTALEHASSVDSNTIVLLDYDAMLADPNETDIEDKLDASGRHKGKHNVLFAHGGVELRETLDLYPVLDGSSWTPTADKGGTPYGVPPVDDEDVPDGTDLEDLFPT